MRKILFIDDEARALEALRDALRSRRRQWQMAFRVGAEAALDELARHDYDVVVSDLSMPGTDGATLLERVRELHPHAIRILMSGSIDLDVIARSTSVAHRLLAKPCDVAELTRVVERACDLHELTQRETQRRIATGVGALPSVPGTYTRISAVLEEPESSTRDAALVVEQDPALAAKVLQLANSAFFGRTQPVASVDRAVARIGLRALATLALSAGAFETFAARTSGQLSIDALQRHAALVARIAPRLLPTPQAHDDVLTAGLLHDIGILVLSTQDPEYFDHVLGVATRDGRPLPDVEYEQRGVSHAEVGAHLLALWGVPDTVVEAVAYHHRPEAAHAPALDTVAAVAIAEQLAHDHQPHPCAAQPAAVAPTYLERIGVGELPPEWHELAKREAAIVYQ